MKRIILSALCLIAAMTASAQQFMRIWQAADVHFREKLWF